jgi:hypothetical protein
MHTGLSVAHRILNSAAAENRVIGWFLVLGGTGLSGAPSDCWPSADGAPDSPMNYS